MNPELARHFESLTIATNQLLKEVASLSSANYHLRPAENKWSVSEILTHLLISEKLSLNYMQKKSRAHPGQLGTAGMKEEILFFVLKMSQRVPLKYRAPRVVRENTPEPLSFGELVRQWEVLRTEMKSLLDSIGPDLLHKQIYKHPVAGRLSATHAVRFMTLHLNHHYPQVTSIISRCRQKK